MANTNDNVKLTVDDGWTDAYSILSEVTGATVAVGAGLEINLLSGGELYICVSETQPTSDRAYKLVRNYGGAVIDPGEEGVWIKAPFNDILLNIEETL